MKEDLVAIYNHMFQGTMSKKDKNKAQYSEKGETDSGVGL
jgi:hypothetical protein